MSINYELKISFFNFLSNKTFSEYEFKHIRSNFINKYPKYEPKKFYQNIYSYFMELVNLGLVQKNDQGCTYKYSSSYSKIDMLSLINFHKSKMENEVNEEKYKKTLLNDNSILSKQEYEMQDIADFPILSDLIIGLISKKEAELSILKNEIIVLKRLIINNKYI
ncbi:hypothetical protein [Acinetobacter sp. YH16057]|uniref:hypothetical protein n=1 Tax=Acinetobacter sp. YH16057 TaxID=2601195 RepID=UPI0015D298A9|nr:hypothetical protein [Acinetobacter sp. YH16057]